MSNRKKCNNAWLGWIESNLAFLSTFESVVY